MSPPSPAPALRIGLRFEPPASGEGDAAGPEWIGELARAEEAGFDVVWIAERPTRADALVPSALLVCAGLAARTERLRVATGLLPLPLHHPLRVAEDAATLDLVSDGRFELGLGLGSDPLGLESWGVAREERSARFEEAVTLVQKAFTGRPTSFQGRHFHLEGTAVTPAPRTPGGPPIWVGATRPEAQGMAARLGAGLMLPESADPSPYLQAHAKVEAHAEGEPMPDGPRLAWLLEGAADPVERAAALGRETRAATDLVFPLPEAGLDAVRELPGLVRDALRGS
ncbi:MAG: LLM class flavin-dependent oxidoreductase [Myxococcota bacterium]|nr:LLM class flavin-dependent oxidoreductase [Myxococcota bacterium]